MAVKNKSKKAKKSQQQSSAQLRQIVMQATQLFASHGVLIMFLVAGATIGFSLVRARSYLNPSRDEDRYNDNISHITYSKIDYTLVNRLEASLNRAPINVGQSLAPNRKNPFTE